MSVALLPNNTTAVISIILTWFVWIDTIVARALGSATLTCYLVVLICKYRNTQPQKYGCENNFYLTKVIVKHPTCNIRIFNQRR